MKVALLSTPWITTPPQGYGGIELVVANIAEGLVKKGHEVMVFATSDSTSCGKIKYYYAKSLGNDANLKLNPYYLLNHIHRFFKIIKQEKYDIIHNHAQYFPMYFCDLVDTPFIHTLHGAYYQSLKSVSGFEQQKRELLLHFKNHPFVSISDNQRMGMPELNYIKTVYNGIKIEEFQFYPKPKNYLAWLGRITPNKGVDIAIKVAKRAGLPIKIAAFIDPGDRKYFETSIKPLIDENVEMIGEIKNNQRKSEFLGSAIALLFPIRWHEPFGLVMAESMLCGTPVIGFNKGSVSEVVENNKTGFIVENEEEMVNCIAKINSIDRNYCHEHSREKFSIDTMVNGYLDAYQTVIDNYKK